MGFWNTRGLRGSSLETLINFTNDFYRQKGLALFQKIPTPITPVKVNNEKRRITLAYFEQQSTVDYMGVVQGIPVCFDAKETTLKSLPIQNIHPHQIQFMNDFQKQKGISFVMHEEKEYPERLKKIVDKPYGLYYMGGLPKEEMLSVAIIGARDCSRYGFEVAKNLGKLLGEYKVQVVSGMARGIDGAGV